MAAIEQTVTVDVPREKVFQALTESEMLDRWWTTRSESEAKTGGRFHYVWEFEDEARNGQQEGRYAEVSVPERVRYPWDTGEGETEVTFELTSSNGGTEVRLRHTGWDGKSDEVREMIAQAWGAFLSNFESVLGGGPDRRPEMLGQKVG